MALSLKQRFEAFSDDYAKFDRVKNKFSNRSDIHAFILLDRLFPHSSESIISAAEHDQYFLAIDIEELNELTDDQIQELVRCRIQFNDEFDCLAVFA